MEIWQLLLFSLLSAETLSDIGGNWEGVSNGHNWNSIDDVDGREEKISLAAVETGTAVGKVTGVESLFAKSNELSVDEIYDTCRKFVDSSCDEEFKIHKFEDVVKFDAWEWVARILIGPFCWKFDVVIKGLLDIHTILSFIGFSSNGQIPNIIRKLERFLQIIDKNHITH